MRRWRWMVGGLGLLLLGAVFSLPLVATATDDVAFCMSCHVMAEYGESHATAVHRESATCSDCHTGSLVQKYTDGVRHLTANLTGKHPVPIQLREQSRKVVAAQCAECHNPTSLHSRQKQERQQNCLECHMGHNERAIILPGVSN